MSTPLPARPNLDWYRKAAKQRLARMRAEGRTVQLAEAQLAVAREHGFPGWRALKTHVEATLAAALFDAIANRDLNEVERLLAAHATLIAARSPEGQTPLHAAAESNQPQIVRLLMKQGADARARYGSSAHNALSWALTTGAVDAARTLIDGGVVPDLFCAAGLGDLDAVKSFFDADGGVRPGASHTGSSRFDASGRRLPSPPTDPREVVSDALCFASRNGQPHIVRFLLMCDPDLGFRAFLAGTALHWAWYSSTSSVITMLLKAGADPTLRDAEFRCTPRAFGICVTASWGLAFLVRRALALDPTLVNIRDGRGTPLHEAARAGAIDVVRLLLAAGADPIARDEDDRTPRELAEREQRHEAAALLSHAERLPPAQPAG
jgi:ankyrin repeat protein